MEVGVEQRNVTVNQGVCKKEHCWWTNKWIMYPRMLKLEVTCVMSESSPSVSQQENWGIEEVSEVPKVTFYNF